VEILVAMFIFAVIATTLFGSFRSLFGQAGSVEGRMHTYAMAQYCLNRMTLDLRSLHVAPLERYTPPGMAQAPDPFRFAGDVVPVGPASFGRLRFASLAHLPFENSPLQGVAEIVYYVMPDEKHRFVLRRADRIHPGTPFAESRKDPVIAEGVRSLALRYFDAQGTAYEAWDSDSGIYDHASPAAVEIALALDEASGSVLFKTLVTLPVSRKKLDEPSASP
jgi:general secretion pathway protein J